LRPYGQKRVTGRRLTLTARRRPGGKIHLTTRVKNPKRERAEPVPCDGA
jgi:hypothetical protein